MATLQAKEIPVELIDRDPAQLRRYFDEGALAELAASIRVHGVIQPVEVEATADGRYKLHHGERRLRASKLAGRPTIPAIVAPPRDDETAVVRGLIENLHREDLTVIEEALAYQRLEAMGWSRARITRETGRTRDTIVSRLAWLRLEPEIQQLVAQGQLPVARELADALYIVPDRARVPLAQRIAAKRLALKGALHACQQAAEKLAKRGEAEAAGAARRSKGHPLPMVRAALPAVSANGNGGQPRPVATAATAAEAMCRACLFRPAGELIPSWELVEQAAAETCDECQRRSGPAVPKVCEQCPGVALLRRLVKGAGL